MTQGRRRLSDAEIELWLAVARTVAPRDGAHLPARAAPQPTSSSKPPPAAALPDVTPFLPSYSPPPQPRRPAQPPLAPFEKRFRQKVTRGRVDIDGAIDLHGMTQPQAHGALVRFLRGAAADGARLVIVVTGKGRARAAASPTHNDEPGVLRRAVPVWLRADELRPIVMGFEEAAQPHGGLGALYVRLRRRER